MTLPSLKDRILYRQSSDRYSFASLERISIFFIVAVGLFLRIFCLDRQALWYDEAMALLVEAKASSAMWFNQTAHTNPPLYFTLLHLWMLFFGEGLFSARLFSVFFGIFSVLLIFLLGKKLFSVEVGLLSALFLSISPFHIYYSQEARMYTLLVFFVLLSSYIFLLCFYQDKTLHWLGYIIFVTLGFYSHAYMLFPFFAHSVFYLFFHKGGRSKFKICFVLIFLFWFHRFFIFYKQVTLDMNPWIIKPTLSDLFQTIQHYVLLSWHMPQTLIVMVALYVLLFLLLCFVSKGIFHMMAVTTGRLELFFVLFNLSFSIFLPYLLSFCIVPIYMPGRYDIIGLPFFIFFVAAALSSFKNHRLKISAVIVTIFLTLSVLPTYYFFFQKSNSRYIAAFINNHAAKDDILVFTNFSFLPVSYYRPDCGSCFSYPDNVRQGYILRDGLKGDRDYIDAQIAKIMSRIYSLIESDNKIWLFYNDDPNFLNAALLLRLSREFHMTQRIGFPRNQYTYFQVNECFVFEKRGNLIMKDSIEKMNGASDDA